MLHEPCPPLCMHSFCVKTPVLRAVCCCSASHGVAASFAQPFWVLEDRSVVWGVDLMCSEILHCLDNKYIWSLPTDILLTSFAHSFRQPAGLGTMERDFLRNGSPGSKEVFTEGRKTERPPALHGSLRFISGSMLMARRGNYRQSGLNMKMNRVIHVLWVALGLFFLIFQQVRKLSPSGRYCRADL